MVGEVDGQEVQGLQHGQLPVPFEDLHVSETPEAQPRWSVLRLPIVEVEGSAVQGKTDSDVLVHFQPDFSGLERVVLASLADWAPQEEPAARDAASGVPGRDQGYYDGVAVDVCGASVLQHGVELLALSPDGEGQDSVRRVQDLFSLRKLWLLEPTFCL